jgi:GH25 family lysozyme M1 (1,4-beta-N-acetylmuramidase)
VSNPIPHDPPKGEDGSYGDTCPICDVPWPCPERKRQRIAKRGIENYLMSDLYKPDRSERVEIDGVGAVRWRSPIDWTADLTYGEKGIVMVIHGYDGDHRSDDADAHWVDRWLP